MVNPSPTRSQSARAPRAPRRGRRAVRRFSSGVCAMSRPHAGMATNAGVWSKLTLRLNGRGDTCAYTRQPSAWSACACSMMRSARVGSRLFSASWFQVHATPRAPHQRATRSMSTSWRSISLIQGRNSSTPRAAGRAAEHVDERAQLVVVGGAARHRVRVAVLVDERRRQAERAGGERSRRAPRPAASRSSGGRGALPRLVAHHVDAQVRVADERARRSPRCRARARASRHSA